MFNSAKHIGCSRLVRTLTVFALSLPLVLSTVLPAAAASYTPDPTPKNEDGTGFASTNDVLIVEIVNGSTLLNLKDLELDIGYHSNVDSSSHEFVLYYSDNGSKTDHMWYYYWPWGGQPSGLKANTGYRSTRFWSYGPERVDSAYYYTKAHAYAASKYTQFSSGFYDDKYYVSNFTNKWFNNFANSQRDLIYDATNGGQVIRDDGLLRQLRPYTATQIVIDFPGGVKDIFKINIMPKNGATVNLQQVRIIHPDPGKEHHWGYDNTYYNGSASEELTMGYYGDLLASLDVSKYGSISANAPFFSENAPSPDKDSYDNRGIRVIQYPEGKKVGNRVSKDSGAFGFSFHIADRDGAGLESLTATNGLNWDYHLEKIHSNGISNYRAGNLYDIPTSLRKADWWNMHLRQQNNMTLRIIYYDYGGCRRQVLIPFTYAYYANLMASTNREPGPNGGTFQQNDTVGITFPLAGYKSVDSVELIFKNETTAMMDGLYNTDRYNDCYPITDDNIIVQNMAFYEDVNSFINHGNVLMDSTPHTLSGVAVDPDTGYANMAGNLDKDLLAPVGTAGTIDFFASKDSTVKLFTEFNGKNGVSLQKNGSLKITADRNTVSDENPVRPFNDYSDSGSYIVKIELSSAVKDHITVPVKYQINYTKTDGTKATVGDMATLQEAEKGFYRPFTSAYVNGYTNYKLLDSSTEYNVRRFQNCNFEFMINALDVDTFDSIDLELAAPTGTSARMQISGVYIYKLAKLNKQQGTMIQTQYEFGKTDTRYGMLWSRTYTTVQNTEHPEIQWRAGVTREVLFTSSNPTRNIPFRKINDKGELIEPKNSEQDDDDSNWFNKRPERLSYEEAHKNLGLTKARYDYTVTVDVADLPDAGSANYFYFQLVFKDGTSAVVLANQQLQSDSFRQGKPETFHIKTTQNFGDLQAIRVICDTTSSTSEVFDKLNISKITVELGNSGVGTTWEFTGIGWIDINYLDEGTAHAGGNESADGENVLQLTNAQIVKEFRATSRGTNVTLLFNLATAADSPAASMADMTKPVFVSFTYTDANGSTVTTTPEKLVDLLAAYNGESTTTRMLRPNHADHFTHTFTGITSLVSINFTQEAGGSGKEWKIAGVSASRSGTLGDPYISPLTDEYVRPDSLVTSEKSLEENFVTKTSTGGIFKQGGRQLSISFENNTISIAESEGGGWSINVGRLPSSTSETLTLYILPGVETLSQKPYEFTSSSPSLNGSLSYTTIYSNTRAQVTNFTVPIANRTTYNGKTVLYASGIGVTAMQSINAVSLSLMQGAANVYIDGVLVERVRGNTVISRYWVDFSNANLSTGKQTRYAGGDTISLRQEQELYLQVSEEQYALLNPEKSDIAVALRYRSDMDRRPNAQRNDDYYTPYQFITDAGYTTVNGGRVLKLKYVTSGVEDLTGISVVSNGPAIKFDSAVAYNFLCPAEHSEEPPILLKENNCHITVPFSAAAQYTTVTRSTINTITPVTFKFVTPETAQNGGTSAAVRGILHYVDTHGSEQTVTLSNVLNNMGTHSVLANGQEYSFTLLLKNVAQLRDIQLIPGSSDDWFIGTVRTSSVEAAPADLTTATTVNNYTTSDAPLTVTFGSEASSVNGISLTAHNLANNESAASTGSTAILTVHPGDNISFNSFVVFAGNPVSTFTWVYNGSSSNLGILTPIGSGSAQLRVPDQVGSVLTVSTVSDGDPSKTATIQLHIQKADTPINPPDPTEPTNPSKPDDEAQSVAPLTAKVLAELPTGMEERGLVNLKEILDTLIESGSDTHTESLVLNDDGKLQLQKCYLGMYPGDTSTFSVKVKGWSGSKTADDATIDAALAPLTSGTNGVYQLPVTPGERGRMTIVFDVYRKDADGNVVLDTDNNPVVDSTKTVVLNLDTSAYTPEPAADDVFKPTT